MGLQSHHGKRIPTEHLGNVRIPGREKPYESVQSHADGYVHDVRHVNDVQHDFAWKKLR